MDREFDLVVFGGSGYTAFFVIREILVSVKNQNVSLKWALAGRNEGKIRQCLNDVVKDAGIEDFDSASVQVILADVSDKESLKKMAERTKLVLNCVGPYRYFGRQVVEACVEAGTSHLDISGEPLYMEDIQLKYFNTAEEKTIHIVSACGFDSIPNDLGINFLQDAFKGTLNTVETYIHGSLDDGGKLKGNSATWDCVVDGVADTTTLKVVRKELYAKVFGDVSTFKPKHSLVRKGFSKHTDPIASGYALPFPGSDRSVARRSQMHNYRYFKERPIDTESYIVFPSAIAVFYAFLIGLFLTLFSKFKYGRYLLHQYPQIFTLGTFVKEPPREEGKKVHVKMVFIGKGWDEVLTDPLDQRSDPPNKTLVTSVSMTDPGYRATGIMLAQSAFTLLQEKDKLPGKGGVWTPGVAFKKTSLVHRLQSRGIEFKVLE